MSLDISHDRLAVHFAGSDRVWALSKGLDVPLAHVVGAEVLPRREAPGGIRAPGTEWPGVIRAGTYRRGGKRRLWNVRRAKEVLVVRLRDERYDAVVVEIPDPAATAARINERR